MAIIDDCAAISAEVRGIRAERLYSAATNPNPVNIG